MRVLILLLLQIAKEQSIRDGENIKLVDSVLFDKEITRLVWFEPEKSENYEIPNNVKAMNTDAFGWRMNSAPKAMDNAFHYCVKLISIVIPNSVTSIGRTFIFEMV